MHLVMIGGSDAGISAALRARELDPAADVTVVLEDAYPNFSICGIPYYVSGEVTHWRNLAHRTVADLEAPGCGCGWTPPRGASTCPAASCWSAPPTAGRNCWATTSSSSALARSRSGPRSAAWPGLVPSAPLTGCTCCTRWATRSPSWRTLEQAAPASAVIVGAGYIGLEMADALTVRGLQVTQMEQLPEVLPTVDPELGALVHAELAAHGVEVLTGTTVQAISTAPPGEQGGCTSRPPRPRARP